MAALLIFIVPLYTFWFGTKENPLEYTLSMIGNQFDQMTQFAIWGIGTGAVLVVYILQLYQKANFNDKKARRKLFLSNVFLVLTVVTPAVEEISPFMHKLHAAFGAFFAINLCLSIFYLGKYLKTKHRKVANKSMGYLFAVVFVSLVLLVQFGNNGIFELFFFLAISVLLFVLNKWIDAVKT